MTLRPTATGSNGGRAGRDAEPAITRRSTMISVHIIAIATFLAVGFGVKLFFFSSPTAEANVDAVTSVRHGYFSDAPEH